MLREWQILAQARDAFLRLALPATGLGALVKASQARIQYSLESGYFPARSADRLAVQFDEMEAGQQLIDLAALENDPSVRERARHAGEVIGGVVTRVLQPKPSFKPCSLEIDSPQARVRCRRDDKIKLVGTNVTGVIRHIEGIQGGGTRLRVEITSGVRSRAVLTVGANVEVMDAGFGYVRVKAFIGARQRQPWIFYDTAAPVLPRPTRIPRRSPVAIAASRRRP